MFLFKLLLCITVLSAMTVDEAEQFLQNNVPGEFGNSRVTETYGNAAYNLIHGFHKVPMIVLFYHP